MSNNYTLKLNDQKVYFVCGGTSTNDIIKSINNHNDNNKGIYDFFFSKSIKEVPINYYSNNYSKLDELGVKEIHMCLENEKYKKIISEIETIYTSIDYSQIETSFILSMNRNINIIYPIPYISNNIKFKEIKKFTTYKNQFGEYDFNKNTTIIKNYWNKNSLKNISNFFNLKKFETNIDWIETNNKNISISNLSNYNYSYFRNFLKKKITEKYKTIYDIDNPINKFIFICDSKLILDLLKETKNIKYKYNKENDIIEYSSLWEIIIDIEFKINSNNIISSFIKYVRFNKIYPTIHNYSPLINNQYEYEYNNNKFKLFNSINYIPFTYIKKLYFYRYSSNIKTAIRDKINKINKVNKINTSNKSNKVKNNKKSISFEELLKSVK